jgi:hypothetical protein
MKVLTILQPWASLIVHGCRPSDYRSWQTAYRGPLAIHAGRRFEPQQRRQCGTLPIERLLNAAGIRRVSDLPLGAIVGVVTLVDCVPTDDGFAWRLADPVALPAPVPCLRQPGLGELPAQVESLLLAQV